MRVNSVEGLRYMERDGYQVLFIWLCLFELVRGLRFLVSCVCLLGDDLFVVAGQALLRVSIQRIGLF